MPVVGQAGRRTCVPVIYTRGSPYDVGFDVGRTFRYMIQNVVQHHEDLNKSHIPFYESPEGRQVYEQTLQIVNAELPQYVRELEGIADGSQIPFFKLFLMNVDDVISAAMEKRTADGTGCSTVFCTKPGQESFGHNEDGLAVFLNNWYIVDAHILYDSPQGRWGITEEKFTNFTYAGMMNGYTMGYNHHGFVYSINTVLTKTSTVGKIPVNFISRSILAAQNLSELEDMLRHPGLGLASGINVNTAFLKEDGGITFRCIEVAPGDGGSSLHLHVARPEEHLFHCNSYQRMKVPDAVTDHYILLNSNNRKAKIESLPPPQSFDDVVTTLHDQTNTAFPVFRSLNESDRGRTLATGAFDLIARTWKIYTHISEQPVASLPIVLKP